MVVVAVLVIVAMWCDDHWLIAVVEVGVLVIEKVQWRWCWWLSSDV